MDRTDIGNGSDSKVDKIDEIEHDSIDEIEVEDDEDAGFDDVGENEDPSFEDIEEDEDAAFESIDGQERDFDIEKLKEETKRVDRIEEEEARTPTQQSEGDDMELEYTPFSDVAKRKERDDDIEDLKKRTKRVDRVSQEKQENQKVKLRPTEELDLEGEPYDSVDDNYCGNCAFVKFRQKTGEPQVHCTKWDKETELESGMACSEYYPQGFGTPESDD